MKNINVKVVLISQYPLPYKKIGSWTNLYKKYLLDSNNKIDYIVCKNPEKKFDSVSYKIVSSSYYYNLKTKFFYESRFDNYINALLAIIKNENKKTKYILQIVDNSGIVIKLNKILKKKKIRDRFYIQYFFHGFSCPISQEKSNLFFGAIDEFITLTNSSSHRILSSYNIGSLKISVLNNGVDKKLFFRLSEEEKIEKRKILGLELKTVFLWCSQDKPKKGLSIILQAWSVFYKKHTNAELWVIGTNKIDLENNNGIKYFGRINNDKLSEYLQIADVYLFPTLYEEGFGLSLVESLHCGLYCIASNLGGINEVLNNGKYGVLINKPQLPQNWINEMELYMMGKNEYKLFPSNLYTIENWKENMNQLIESAKSNI